MASDKELKGIDESLTKQQVTLETTKRKIESI